MLKLYSTVFRFFYLEIYTYIYTSYKFIKNIQLKARPNLTFCWIIRVDYRKVFLKQLNEASQTHTHSLTHLKYTNTHTHIPRSIMNKYTCSQCEKNVSGRGRKFHSRAWGTVAQHLHIISQFFYSVTSSGVVNPFALHLRLFSNICCSVAQCASSWINYFADLVHKSATCAVNAWIMSRCA